MVFLENCHTLVAASTIGELFLWETAGMKHLRKWPTQFWREGPLFCCGPDCVAAAHDGGVCLLSLQTARFREVYTCPGAQAWIAGYQAGKLHILTVPFGRKWERFGYTVVDTQGNLCSRSTLNRALNSHSFSQPVLLKDGSLALLSSTRGSLLNRTALYTIDPCGCVTEFRTVPKTYRRGPCCPLDGAASYGRYLGFIHGVPHGVTMYDWSDGSLVGEISDSALRQDEEIIPPSCILFLSEETLLVGTWDQLLVYRIVPEQEQAM